MNIYDTTPHRRLRPPQPPPWTPPELDFSGPTVAAGALATAIALLTVVVLVLPLFGIVPTPSVGGIEPFVRIEVPVMPGSDRMEDRYLPSLAMMIPPVAGTFVAILGFGAGRKRTLALVPAVGLVGCALAMACWCLYFVWLAMAHDSQDMAGF